MENSKKILRLPDVVSAVGLRKSAIYGLIKTGEFPRPIQLSGKRAVGWVESEVSNFINQRIAARDHGAAQ